MNSSEKEKHTVRKPYTLISSEEIAGDPKLETLINQLQPEAVIDIPQFPELVYLRIQSAVFGGVGVGFRVYQVELGLYYDRATQALIDLEEREDGLIAPTAFEFSTHALLRRRHYKILSEHE